MHAGARAGMNWSERFSYPQGSGGYGPRLETVVAAGDSGRRSVWERLLGLARPFLEGPHGAAGRPRGRPTGRPGARRAAGDPALKADNGSDNVFVLKVTSAGVVLKDANPAFVRSFALSRRKVGSRLLEEVLHPVIASVIAARARECVASGERTEYVQTLPLPGGHKTWLMTLTPLRSPKGSLEGVMGRGRELPGKARVRLRMDAGDRASGSIEFTALPNGRLDHLNPTFFDFTGLPQDAGLDAALLKVHPEDLGLLMPGADDGDESFQAEVRIRGRNGSYQRFSVQADLFDGPTGRRWYGVASPLGRRRAAGAPETGGHLLEVMECLDSCCVTLDETWRVTAVTRRAAAWMGLTPEQILGLDARNDMALPKPLLSAVEASLMSRSSSRVVFPPLLHPGKWAEYQVFPFPGGANIVFWEVGFDELSARADQTIAPQGRANLLAGVQGLIVLLDRDWRITGITPEAASAAGVPDHQLIGVDYRLQWALPDVLTTAIEASFRTGESSAAEFPAVLRPGRWSEVQVNPFREGAYLLFSDITERRRSADADAEAAQFLEGLCQTLSGEIALLDHDFRIVSENAAWTEAVRARGAKGPASLGAEYVTVCRRMLPDLDGRSLEAGLRELATGGTKQLVRTVALRTPGGVRWRELKITPLTVGRTRRFIAVHQDLAAPARVQAELNKVAEQLLSAQDDERQRIAVELHDSTSQHLVALGLGVTRLKRLLHDRGGADDVLQDMSDSLHEAIREIRVLSYLMRPTALRNDGLLATAQRFVKGFGPRTGVASQFQVEGDVDAASEAVQHACYRVIQESMANVYRHAEARHVQVELKAHHGELSVRICDDGKGIGELDAERGASSSLGVGIPGMRARATQLGGRFRIDGGPEGTVVTADFPMQAGEPADASLS
jgi:signal transduction histidine kinase